MVMGLADVAKRRRFSPSGIKSNHHGLSPTFPVKLYGDEEPALPASLLLRPKQGLHDSLQNSHETRYGGRWLDRIGLVIDGGWFW